MTLNLSKRRSIFIQAIIIWQQDEIFVYFSDRNIPMVLICSRYYSFIIIKIIKHSLSIKMMHHSYFYDQY